MVFLHDPNNIDYASLNVGEVPYNQQLLNLQNYLPSFFPSNLDFFSVNMVNLLTQYNNKLKFS